MEKVVIYARYSAGHGQTDQSIEGQVRVCKDFIEKKKKMRLVQIYADKHISGRTANRPEFQRMIADAKKGLFDALVVYTTDRFARSKYDSAIYKTELKKAGVKIYYAAENIPEGPEGLLLEALMEGWAQYYSEELSRKIKRGMYDTATKCKSTGSTPPVGYKVDENRRYVLDEALAPYVVEIFHKYLYDDATYKDCAQVLNDRGFRTGRGKEFSSHQIRRMLSNKRYTGVYIYGDLEVPGGMPRIVSDEIFTEVQKKLKKAPRKTTRGDFPLTGKLYSGICGHPLSGKSGTSKTGASHYYYSCRKCKANKLIPKKKIEQAIVLHTREIFRQPQVLDDIASKLFALQSKERASMGQSEPQKDNLSEINRSIDSILLALEKRPDSESLLNRLDELEKKKRAIEELRIQEDMSKPKILTEEMIREGLKVFIEGFPFDDEETSAKRIIEALVDKVIVNEHKLIITYKIQGLNDIDVDELQEFAHNDDWWTDWPSERTLAPFRGNILLLSTW